MTTGNMERAVSPVDNLTAKVGDTISFQHYDFTLEDSSGLREKAVLKRIDRW